MSEKKLVIKFKYGASALQDKELAAAKRPPEYLWNFRRIGIAFGIVLLLLVVLAYIFFDAKPDPDAEALSAESSVPFAEKTLDKASGFSREQDNAAVRDTAPQITGNSGMASDARGRSGTEPAKGTSEKILRAQFAWGIKDNEPTGTIASPAILQPGHSVVLYFFTEFNGMKGQTAVHEWSRQGRTVFTKEFVVGDDRSRVFSTQRLNSKLLGEWKVAVRIANGANLGEFVLDVLEPAK